MAKPRAIKIDLDPLTSKINLEVIHVSVIVYLIPPAEQLDRNPPAGMRPARFSSVSSARQLVLLQRKPIIIILSRHFSHQSREQEPELQRGNIYVSGWQLDNNADHRVKNLCSHIKMLESRLDAEKREREKETLEHQQALNDCHKKLAEAKPTEAKPTEAKPTEAKSTKKKNDH